MKSKEKPTNLDGTSERLHVRIAHSGFTSRRKAEELIKEGRVTVNGELVMEMGFMVSDSDRVYVDGRPIKSQRLCTVLLNKPIGYITTMSDPYGRRTIVNLLPDIGVVLKPVGRLDQDTEGLLLLTSDGELAHRLAHPSFEIEKEYEAIVEGIPSEATLDKLRRGVYIEGGKTKPAKVSVIHAEPSTQTTSLRFVIHEGRKRQIRLMVEAVGHPILKLRRVRIAHLRVKGMKPGECKILGQEDLFKLRELVGLGETPVISDSSRSHS